MGCCGEHCAEHVVDNVLPWRAVLLVAKHSPQPGVNHFLRRPLPRAPTRGSAEDGSGVFVGSGDNLSDAVGGLGVHGSLPKVDGLNDRFALRDVEHADVAVRRRDGKPIGEPAVSVRPAHFAVLPYRVEGGVGGLLGAAQFGIGEAAERARTVMTGADRMTPDVGATGIAPPEVLVEQVWPVRVDHIARNHLGG